MWSVYFKFIWLLKRTILEWTITGAEADAAAILVDERNKQVTFKN